MLLRLSAWSVRLCCGGLLLGLSGCSRSTVVVAPESPSPSEAAQVTRAKGEGEADKATFAFPADKGGALLAKVLPPRQTEAAQPDRARRPRPSPPPFSVKVPTLPLPASPPAAVRLPLPKKPSALQPQLVTQETLGGWQDAPALPEVVSLPAGERVRLPSVDVNQPIPLPVLAQLVPDRAPLDDATAEASAAAAVAAPPPQRLNMAPFLRLTLPDPYDHRRTGTIPVPAEGAEPVTATPQLPKP
jgi:hypothetical protein